MSCSCWISPAVYRQGICFASKPPKAWLDGPVKESQTEVNLTMCGKEAKNALVHKYLTQQEVADLFRVKPATVKNWREAGLLEYFQPPGSSRVLYPKMSVEEFERRYTQKAKVIPFRKPAEIKRIRPEVSTRPKKEWRI